MNLSDEERRYITEKVLGECWHDISKETYSCRTCGMSRAEIYMQPFAVSDNRTLTTHSDLAEVYGKLVENGEGGEFWRYACSQCNTEIATKQEIDSVNIRVLDATLRNVYGRFDVWLHCLAHSEQIPERMRMVIQFKKEREK